MTLTDRVFNRLILTIMTIGFLALVAAGATAVWAVNRNRAFAGWVDHTYRVELELSAFRFLIECAEAARRGYLVYPDAGFEANYRQTTTELRPTLDTIASLTADNPVQQKRIAALRPMIEQQLAAGDQSFEKRTNTNLTPVAAFRGDGSVATTLSIRTLTRDMAAEESRLLATRTADQRSGTILLSAVLWVTGVLLLMVGAALLWIIRRYTGALTQSQAALQALIQTWKARSPSGRPISDAPTTRSSASLTSSLKTCARRSST